MAPSSLLAFLDPGTVLILIPLISIPIATLMFITGAGKALDEIGKGPMAMDHDVPAAGHAPASKAVREAEIRQFLEAKAYRAEARGEKPIDVEREMESLLAFERLTHLTSYDGEGRGTRLDSS